MTKRSKRRGLKLSTQSILELLKSEDESDRRAVGLLVKRATTAEIIAVLTRSDHPDVRAALCYGLSRRCDADAIPVLVENLRYPEKSVSALAAEALGNIGDVRSGPALLQHFQECSDNLSAYALGAVGYRPAIPLLIQALSDPDIRGSAAISLGSLGALEAKTALQTALDQETGESTRKLITRALAAIDVVHEALNAKEFRVALPGIVKALESRDIVLNQAAVRALVLIGSGSGETEGILRSKLSSLKDNCILMQRINETLEVLSNPTVDQS